MTSLGPLLGASRILAALAAGAAAPWSGRASACSATLASGLVGASCLLHADAGTSLGTPSAVLAVPEER
jgi:hypothetical protein